MCRDLEGSKYLCKNPRLAPSWLNLCRCSLSKYSLIKASNIFFLRHITTFYSANTKWSRRWHRLVIDTARDCNSTVNLPFFRSPRNPLEMNFRNRKNTHVPIFTSSRSREWGHTRTQRSCSGAPFSLSNGCENKDLEKRGPIFVRRYRVSPHCTFSSHAWCQSVGSYGIY